MITGIADVARDLERLVFALDGPSLPGSIGTPAFFIARRALALSPSRRMTFGSGPMKRMWHASHTSARYALSDRNP